MNMIRFGRTAIAGSVLLFVLAGCSTAGSSGSPTTTAADPGAASASPSLPAPAGATANPVQIFDRSGRNQAGFSAPGGDISCAFTTASFAAPIPSPSSSGSKPAKKTDSTSDPTGQVRCEIAVKDWQPPPQPASCTADWGSGLVLDTRPAMLCASDTIRGDSFYGTDGSVILPYGTAFKFAPFSCSSQRSGVDCRNTANGAEFLLTRERYVLRDPQPSTP
jgi:hypothetical protein